MNRTEGVPFVPKEFQKKKEPMSDAKIGDLLASIGNHEGKALLLASMKPHEPYTAFKLRGLIRDGQNEQEVWPGLSNTIPFNWCERTLSPIGLVAKEVVDAKKGTVGYMMTEEGQEIGQAFAGHMLDFSERHPEVSLYQLFGSTTSVSKREVGQGSRLRSPLTRIRLFTELMTRDLPIREADIMQSLMNDYPDTYDNGIKPLIETHLKSLSESGILSYKSVKVNSPFVFYKRVPDMPGDTPTVYRSEYSLTKEVFSVLPNTNHNEFSLQDICNALIAKYPEKAQLTSLYGQVGGVLRHFEKEGYTENSGDFTLKRQSEVTITDTQYETLSELVGLIETFRNGDSAFLAEGREKARMITSDPERFASLLEKAKNASPTANKIDVVETTMRLQGLIADNPQSSGNELQEFFAERYGKRLGKQTLHTMLKAMRAEGHVTAEKQGTRLHYSIVSEEANKTSQSSFPSSGTIFERE